uniref:TssC1 N-terminal domain-containing protein n=1 Tax=Eiseniibacteriota bacterium TaxID=2212470 RepID=A0A832I702_UNCEI
MKPLPWRILVLTEAVPDAGAAVRVPAGDPDAWLAAAGASVEVPKPGGGTATLAPRRAADFEPAAVAAALGADVAPAAVDAALHAPAFQRLEAAYRGLALLLAHAGDAVAVEVQGAPRAALAGPVRDAVYAREVAAEDPLTLVVVDHDFTHRGADLAVLRALAETASALQVPLVANAGAGFFDVRFLVQIAAFQELMPRLGTAAHAPWREFQASEPARWTALTINRFLLRAPWTPERGGHAEAVTDSNPESYLWGRGGWLVAAAVARSAREHGHALAIAGAQGGRFEGLPTRAFPTAVNETRALATETTVTDAQMPELERVGFTPLIGPLGADSVLLPMVLTTFRLRPGVLTVEATLAYQILAARLAHTCARLLDTRPGDPAAAVEHLRAGLVEFLGGFAGEDPAAAVAVEVREVADGDRTARVADVRVTPKIVLEGKNVEFAFGLPLG